VTVINNFNFINKNVKSTELEVSLPNHTSLIHFNATTSIIFLSLPVVRQRATDIKQETSEILEIRIDIRISDFAKLD